MDAILQMCRWLLRAMAFCCQTELLQHLGVNLERIRLRGIIEPHLYGKILIGSVCLLEIACLGRDIGMQERAILDIGIQLVRIGRTAPFLIALFTAESGQRADTVLALMIDDIVTIILEFWCAITVHHAGQTKPCTQIKQHRLEAAHITIRFHHRPANGIGNTVSLADRPIKQLDRVIAFEICRVRQNQIGIGNHLG